MKKLTICTLLAGSILFTSCIGSFSAFNGLRNWNQNVTDSKFGNEVIFLALWILPVYSLATLGDLLIFNTIEFWGGDNPIAMNEGDSETRIVESKGSTYEITATKNRFHITIIDGKNKGATNDLVYLPEDKSWNVEHENGELTKLTSLKKGLRIVHMPNGDEIEVNQNMSRNAQRFYVDSKIQEYKECQLAEL